MLEPGVKAVEVEDVANAAVDDVVLIVCLLAADEAVASVTLEEAVTCCPPVGKREGTFRLLGAVEANMSTESTLSEEDDEAKLKADAFDEVTLDVPTACVILEFSFL